MNEQLGFGGLLDEGKPDRHLFLAIRPKGLVAEEIVKVSHQVSGGRGTPRPIEHLHVSLNGLGQFIEVPEKMVRAVDEACAKVVAKTKPFPISFTKVMPFGGGSMVMTAEADDNPLLRAMYQALERELMWSGAKRTISKSLTPHLTMRYGEHRVQEQRVARLSWVVREIELINSWQEHTHYDLLGSWELRGSDSRDVGE